MKTNNTIAIILSFTAYVFISFNYMPAMIQLSALENERLILLQVLKKNNEFEQKLFQEKTAPQVKSVPRPVGKKKQMRKKSQEIKPPVQMEKKIKGNRGFLIRDGKPNI